MTRRTQIIAEAGVNHNGSLDMALALIDAAKTAGADVVKFQTFKSEAVISRNAVKAEYQKTTTGSDESQLDMVRKLELSHQAHHTLVEHCASSGITFLSTPFDLESLIFLTDDLGLDTLKLPSGEITNGPLLLAAARKGVKIILSTGMSSLGDIEAALGILAFGYIGGNATPSRAAFAAAYAATEGQRALQKNLTLLHCTTEYPAPFPDINLRAMQTLEQAFGLPVGYSDHSEGICVSIAAAALGACALEKHFTLDRSLPGPDHKASLEPTSLASLVRSVREVEQALGSPLKCPAPSEIKNIPIARKSLVAASAIRKGELFTEANLTTKRPGSGVSALEYWDWLGRVSEQDYAEDEVIS